MFAVATPRREYQISTYDMPCVTAPMRRQHCSILLLFTFMKKYKLITFTMAGIKATFD
jgi:hypothetical protein